ncbi:MAG: ROK family transcriptional regulator [Anaerolineales bacterium]|nr:ROK family transcriptional regulator [Anaerolineales bacterium]
MPKATRQQTKEHNIRLVLKTIYNRGGISRAEIARATRLTKTTVSSIVAELMQEGFVAETGVGASDGGKPPILLSVVDSARCFIGIDLANSAFRGATVNMRGDIVHRLSLPVHGRDGNAALELVYALVEKLLAESDKPIGGVGIGTPGLVDPENGVIRRAVNLNWRDLPLRRLVERRFNLPCYIANDCQAAALGEYTFAHDSTTSNLIVVKVGRGVGSGIVLNGKLYYGDGYSAGEIGHLVVVEGGDACACGNRGCLETVASTQALVRRAREIARAKPESLLHQFAATPDQINTETVLQAFNAGDEDLRRLVVEAGNYLGIAVANFIGVLNIQRIVIAGSMARFGDVLLDAIQQMMHRYSISILADETKVELSSLGQDIVIKGAASLLLANELKLV